MPFSQWVSGLGVPLAGGKLYFYAYNTSTPLATYSDFALATPNTNPVVADANGTFGAINLQLLDYTVVLKTSDNVQVWTGPVHGDILHGSAASYNFSLAFKVDGGGSVPGTGVVDDYPNMPFACTILDWTIQADQAGSLSLDVWKKAFAIGSPPTVANTIVAAAPPTLTAAQSNQNATLAGWTVAIAAGDHLRLNLASITTITRFTLVLTLKRTF